MDLVLLDWDNNQAVNLLEDLILDEPILMVRRLITHKVFLTNFVEDIKTDIEPACNMFGFHKSLKLDNFLCYEYDYSNTFKFNNYLSNPSFDFDSYANIHKASEDDYFSIDKDNEFKTLKEKDNSKKYQA
jgi:hypothetical protein